MACICLYQGRRRHFESGTAIGRGRCSPSAKGTSGREDERGQNSPIFNEMKKKLMNYSEQSDFFTFNE